MPSIKMTLMASKIMRLCVSYWQLSTFHWKTNFCAQNCTSNNCLNKLIRVVGCHSFSLSVLIFFSATICKHSSLFFCLEFFGWKYRALCWVFESSCCCSCSSIFQIIIQCNFRSLIAYRTILMFCIHNSASIVCLYLAALIHHSIFQSETPRINNVNH